MVETCRVDDANRLFGKGTGARFRFALIRKKKSSTNSRIFVRSLVKEDEVFACVEFLRARE